MLQDTVPPAGFDGKAELRQGFTRIGIAIYPCSYWIVQRQSDHGGVSRAPVNGYAATPLATGSPQWAHRRASTGISLKHSGHFFVVGSAGAGAFLIRATSA